jgi:hypothetical protein
LREPVRCLAFFTLGGVGNDPGYDNLFYPNVASLVDDRGIEFLINDNQTRGLRNVVGSDQDVLSNGALLPVSALTIVSVDGNPIGTPTPPTATPTPVGPTPVPEKGRPVLALIACCAGLVLGFGSAGKPGWA